MFGPHAVIKLTPLLHPSSRPGLHLIHIRQHHLKLLTFIVSLKGNLKVPKLIRNTFDFGYVDF